MIINASSNEIGRDKATLLYLFNKINKPIESGRIFQVVAETSQMNYFYFQQFLLDLVNEHFLSVQNDNYQITNLGKETLSLVEYTIPGIQKFKIDDVINKKFSEIIRASEIKASTKVISENEILVTLGIYEKGSPLLEVKLSVSSIKEAESLIEKWKSEANSKYEKILKAIY
jgi:hypothetical protein